MPIEVLPNGPVVTFGFGDVLINHAEQPEEPEIAELVLVHDPLGTGVGEYLPEERWPEIVGKRTDEFPYCVRLQFSRGGIKGLDVLIEELIELRKDLMNNGC